ncbi:MAG: hypothetical protein JOY80_11420, partial [Candidatus Dormibacteraeota bacterium]|nr:hypothetical protein [Candidatus Dormibacteraeota bacterium]
MITRVANADSPPPAMTFTKNADVGSGKGSNEPQLITDQTGKTYLTWQGDSTVAFPGTLVNSTTDGTSFTTPKAPDPPGTGTELGGDVALATTNWPSFTDTPAPNATGGNGVFWMDLATPPANTSANCAGDPQTRSAVTNDQAATWGNQQSAGCQPALVDREWEDSYTDPAFRGSANARAHTVVFGDYHDLASSAMWLVRSSDGGTTWDTTPYSVFNSTTTQGARSDCNTIVGGIATDKRGAHKGRVYVTWSSSDVTTNVATGCNDTQAQPFDHVFIGYSDDAVTGATPPTFHLADVFDDPCASGPGGVPTATTITQCQDVSELFTPVTVDDA